MLIKVKCQKTKTKKNKKKNRYIYFKNINVGIQFNGKQFCQKQVHFCGMYLLLTDTYLHY